MFTDRHEAGKKLAEKLGIYRGTNAVVLALPRGGVVIGYEVAQVLRLPLDIIAVRKIGRVFKRNILRLDGSLKLQENISYFLSDCNGIH